MSELPLNKSKGRARKASRSPLFQPRSLNIKEWSHVDQRAWEEAIRPAVRLQRGGAAAHLAAVSQKDIANRYGLYLDFMQRNGLFDPTSGAAKLVVLDHVQHFLAELEMRVSSVTIWNSIYKLRRAAECLAPTSTSAGSLRSRTISRCSPSRKTKPTGLSSPIDCSKRALH